MGLRSEKYGVHEYLPSITFKGNLYSCVFAPFTRVELQENEEWRWDSCIINNKEILIPHTTYFYQDNYEIKKNVLKLESVYAYGMTLNSIAIDFDCDVTECLNPKNLIDYTGYAICSKDGKKKSDYFVFFFSNGILEQFDLLAWNDFEKFLRKDDDNGGCIRDCLLKSGWLNWDVLYER